MLNPYSHNIQVLKHNTGFLYSSIHVCTFETDLSGCFRVLDGKLLPCVSLFTFLCFHIS